jgi:hypothetical protein
MPQEKSMTQQRPPPTKPDDYPSSLDGGEAPGHSDHRVGETQRQNPKSDRLDPSHQLPDPGDAKRDEAARGS